MSGVDLHDPETVHNRNSAFVEVYEHDSNLDKLPSLDNGLRARVVIGGWDKPVRRPIRIELYDLRRDTDSQHNLFTLNRVRAFELDDHLTQWLK